MSDVIRSDGDPHDEIERLEAQIEGLAAKIENCRKFILAGRIAAGVGGVLLVALLLGAIRGHGGATYRGDFWLLCLRSLE